MRIVRRVAELAVDQRFELLRERVLQSLRLLVDVVDPDAEPLRQELLEQAVVAEHLDRHALAPGVRETPRYRSCCARPREASFLIIADAAGAETPMRSATADVGPASRPRWSV